MCGTVALRHIPAEQLKTYEPLGEAQEQAISALRPAVTALHIDNVVRQVLAKAGTYPLTVTNDD